MLWKSRDFSFGKMICRWCFCSCFCDFDIYCTSTGRISPAPKLNDSWFMRCTVAIALNPTTFKPPPKLGYMFVSIIFPIDMPLQNEIFPNLKHTAQSYCWCTDLCSLRIRIYSTKVRYIYIIYIYICIPYIYIFIYTYVMIHSQLSTISGMPWPYNIYIYIFNYIHIKLCTYVYIYIYTRIYAYIYIHMGTIDRSTT